MKIGYNEATAMKKSNLITDLRLAEKYGYDYIEIRLDMLERYLEGARLADLAAFFGSSNLKPYALNAIEEINFLDAPSFSMLAEKVKRACNAALRIDNPYLIAVPSFRNEQVLKKSLGEIEKDTVDSLNRLADIAETFGVKIAFEPVGFSTCAVRSMGQAWDILKKVDRDSVGLVIDAFNVYIYNGLKDMDVLREINTEKIFVFHINDYQEGIPIEEAELEHRMWPGDGVIPLADMICILKEKGFDKIASIEVFRPEYWELQPETALKIAKEKTERIVKNVAGRE